MFQRKKGIRNPYKIFLACEGTSTEPTYFEEVGRHLRNSRYEIVVIDQGNGNRPDDLLNQIASPKKEQKG